MPDIDRIWNLRMVRAREAMAMLPLDPDGLVDWNGVEIAHTDTGYTHNPVFLWDGDQSPILSDGGNYMEPGTRPRDPLNYRGYPGHGTRTASVLCGNLPGSFVGVAPGAPTVSYRVTNTVVLGRNQRKKLARAIRHAGEAGCEVVSISLGIPGLSVFGRRLLGQAVDEAYDNGIIVVGAGGQVIDVVTYPGKFFRTIGVGGVTPEREVWFEYNRVMLKFIDVWAPADPIRRANTVLANGQEQYDFGNGDGTSYSTIHVAGAAAMWLVYRGDQIETKYSKPWMRIEAFRKLLKKTHQDVEGDYQPAPDTGILDIKGLLDADLPRITQADYEKRKAVDQYL